MKTLKSLLLCFLLSHNLIAQPVFTIYDQSNTPEFTTNFFRGIAVGKYGHIWAGSQNQGLYRFNGTSWQKATVLQTNFIRALAAAPDSSIWVAQSGTGTSNGSTNINGGVNHIIDTGYTMKYWGYLSGLPTRACVGVSVSNTGNVYTSHFGQTSNATPNALIRGGGLGFGNDSVTNFSDIYAGMPYNGGLYNGTTNVPYYDQQTLGIGTNGIEVWIGIGRSCNNGSCIEPRIARYNANGAYLGSITSADSIFPFTTLTTTPVPRSIFFDSKGRVWVGLSSGGGIFVLQQGQWYEINHTNSSFVQGSSVNFHAITEGDFGNIYIGTDAGLIVVNSDDYQNPSSYRLYNASNGLPGVNVTAIAKANDAMWLTTNAGIVKMVNKINGVVRNAILNYGLLDLQYPNFPNAKVVLYENSVAVDSVFTNALGEFKFDSRNNSSTYSLRISFNGAVNVSCNVQDANLNEPYVVTLPYDLYGQLQNELTSLGKEEFAQAWFYDWINWSPLTVSAYNTLPFQQVADSLLEFDHAQNKEVIEAFARMWAIAYGLDELSKNGAGMISMTTSSLIDVGEMLFTKSALSKKLERLFPVSNIPFPQAIKKRINILSDGFFNALKTYLPKATFGVGDINLRINKRARLLTAIDGVWALARSASLNLEVNTFEKTKNIVQDALKNLIAIPVYKLGYVGLTQSNINIAAPKISNYSWNQSLENAYTSSIRPNQSVLFKADSTYIADSTNLSDLKRYSDYSSIASDAFTVASAISAATVIGTSLIPALKALAELSKGFSFGAKVAAAYTGFKGCYSTYKATFPLTEKLSARYGAPSNEYRPERLRLSTATTNYISLLNEIRAHIMNGERIQVAAKSDQLITIDDQVFAEMKQLSELITVYSSGPISESQDWINFINNNYVEVNNVDLSKKEALNLNMIAYLLDENNEYGTEYILSTIDDVLSHTQIMQNLHDSLSVASQSWSIPPGILANPNYPYIAQGSSSIPLSISVKNFSSAPASDVYVKLTSTGGLSFASDSIYIGTIAPGADIIVPVNCIAPISDTLTTFTAEVFSSNVNGIGSGGAILIENGGILTNSHEVTNNKNDLIVYPNPSNGQLIIRFDSDAIRNLKMFDIHGREVLRTNLRSSLSNINIQNLSNGIYLLSVFENGSVKSIRVVKQ